MFEVHLTSGKRLKYDQFTVFKLTSLSLALFLAFGILGASFSVCQGLTPQTCDPAPSIECSAQDDFCQKMCRLGQKQSPVLLQKKAPETLVELNTPIIHAQGMPTGLPEPAFASGARFELNVPHESAPVDVYLIHAAFLI